ncbi:MAG: hypothetical protein AB9883_07740 [Acidaminococcaceae bacterium]
MIQQSDTLIATVEHLATVVEEQAEIIKRLSLENAQLQEVENANLLYSGTGVHDEKNISLASQNVNLTT